MSEAGQTVDLGIEGLEDAVLIGQGGFGAVYRARQPRLNRIVAVKVLATVLDAAARERFEREGFAMGTVAGHPNILPVHGIGTTDGGRPYLLMPYVPGGSLDRALPMPWREAVRHGVRLCAALGTAHAAGVLHRDLKPANVLRSEFGEPLLADFGIARVTSGFQTASGVVNVSLPFAAPEILDGQPASVAADVYALAASVHCLIAAAPPFAPAPGEQLVSTYLRIARDSPPDLRLLGVPDPICAALEAALAKDPAARPPSAVDFGRLLQAAQRQAGEPETPMALAAPAAPASAPALDATGPTEEATVEHVSRPTRPVPSRRPLIAVIAAVAVLSAAGLVYLGRSAIPVPGRQPAATTSADEVTKPSGLAIASDGAVYVSDAERHRVVRISPAGRVTVVAGTGTPGNSGDGGRATQAGLEYPSAVALAPSGEIYVATGGLIRRIAKDGVIWPVSGFGDFHPLELAMARDGTLYAADRTRIVTRAPTGSVAELATLRSGFIEDLAVHPAGWLAVSDSKGNQILKIGRDGTHRRYAGLGTAVNSPKGDGFPALESAVPSPTGLAFDATGRLYFSEANSRVRVIEATGVVRTVAGSPEGYSEGDTGDGGPGRSATFRLLNAPLAVAPDGTLYIGDVGNHRVRRLAGDQVTAFA